MQLTLAQQFELHKLNSLIDRASSKEELKKICRQLLQAWFVQRSAVNFVLKQKLTEFNKETFPELYEQQPEGA